MANPLRAFLKRAAGNFSLNKESADGFSSGETISLFGNEIIPFAAPPAASKSLPVFQSQPAVAVIESGNNRFNALLDRQPNVKLLRAFAKNSVWIRAAIDYYRRTIENAQLEIVPVDSTKNLSRRDKQAKIKIENLLEHPNAAEEPYSQIKGKAIEDYLTLGCGAIYLDLNNDLTVRGVQQFDGALLGFVKEWDGTDLTVPRYAVFDEKNPQKIKGYLAHQQVMCLVNRPTSFSKIGTGHVEILYKTIVALLSGDEFLINQFANPKANKLIDLGEDANAQQVNQFKYELQQVKDALAVVGGSKGTKVHNLSGSAEEMKILDGAIWFVRQVAAVFGISTAKLKLAVDTSRANTESMMDDDLEAVTAELTRIEKLENSTFIKRYTYDGEINLKFFYPIMHRKDEKTQSIIAKTQTGNNFCSINEARQRVGEKVLDKNDYPYADEVIMNHPKLGPVPMSVYTKFIQEMEKNIGKETDENNDSGASGGDQTIDENN